MSQSVQQQLEDQFNDVVSRLESKQFFQSDWDIASFAVFFIFIGELKWKSWYYTDQAEILYVLKL